MRAARRVGGALRLRRLLMLPIRTGRPARIRRSALSAMAIDPISYVDRVPVLSAGGARVLGQGARRIWPPRQALPSTTTASAH
jgi:hypothetical protein